MNETCMKHALNMPDIGTCPYCEIDRLKGELEEAEKDHSTTYKLQQENHQLWAIINGIGVGMYSKEESIQMLVGNLERQLSRFKHMAEQNSTEMCEWMEKYNEAIREVKRLKDPEERKKMLELTVTEARQQAAREIMEMMGGWPLQNETLITCRALVKTKFGLEG